MEKQLWFLCSTLLIIRLLVCSPAISAGDLSTDGGKRTYIVRVDRDAKPSIFPTHGDWYESTVTTISSAISAEAATAESPIIHLYTTVFHGFSARLHPSTATTLSDVPGVVSVIPELIRHHTTTRSPEFLGLRPPYPSAAARRGAASLLAETHFGSDLVVAVIDTGISPSHPSFSDRGLGPIPPHWHGHCHPSIECNKKLIGAAFFSNGYEASSGPMNETVEVKSPLDSDGHGTHTASIAAGRYVYPADLFGLARGLAAGVAPKARLAVYKVCWAKGCFDSDILAAFDAAVQDGVDVISLSVGGVVLPFHLDAIAVAAFAASADHGIFVSASAGNGGPAPLSVTNVAPWLTTVAAGSLDRDFPAQILLANGHQLPAISLYSGPPLPTNRMLPLVYAGDGGAGDGYSASLCLEGSLNANAVAGKIVVCDRGVSSRAAKGATVKAAGAAGMILANGLFDGEGLVADPHVLPSAAVGAATGDKLRHYISSAGANAAATIVFHGTRLGVSPAPVVAAFSARGPNPQSPEILKPDLVAPGLDILAAWPSTVSPAGIPSDTRRTQFNILSGTSMACPHVSGLAALLKAAHPDWSPAAVRSALMTTAYTVDNRGETMLDESTGNSSDIFAFGAGHVHPQHAMDPGLVYDISAADYVNYLCNLNYTQQGIRAITRRPADCKGARLAGHAGNLNYPSFAAVFTVDGGKQHASTHFIRTVTNVGSGRAVYGVKIRSPDGVKVAVEPKELVFRRGGQKLSYLVRVEAETAGVKLEPGSSVMRSGEITWSDGGRHTVNSPIVVSIQAPV